MRPSRLSLSFAALALGAATLAGCAGSTDETDPSAAAVVEDSTVVLDVRTPAEFADGHLEGALNIDVSGLDFDAQLAALDPAETYAVYCRSGNRSAQAAQLMAEAGFGEVIDLGSVSEAAEATDLPIVTD
ncbi:rhodanese-like domain-containing protein [Serinibacter salmoneus]|uniref:Rhodanese-related sulfurtransferase n=1 Tax=Serinibacter salmoneus TaxID=556530 RepID=A0A2A9CWA0_9MICO|nr:rhodanese-like domain-containing protein [Serinibacter salmoneus]PFG18704.1 rhodanese-related sulfurtransferase [Serinibacter salmoneus]